MDVSCANTDFLKRDSGDKKKKKGQKSAWGWVVSLHCMYIGHSYRMCRKLCEEWFLSEYQTVVL